MGLRWIKEFTTGFDDLGTFTVNISTNELTVSAPHGLAVGNRVELSSGGEIPEGLGLGTYYVVSVPSTTKLIVSEAYGGTPANILDIGTGTHIITRQKGYHLMMSNPNTQLLMNCDCDPCHGWLIVNLCACEVCGEPSSVVELGTSTEFTIGGETLKTIIIGSHAANGTDGSTVNWGCTPAILTSFCTGLHINSVQHLAQAAPFDGTVSVEVFIDETEVEASAWTGDCEYGVSPYIGDDTFDAEETNLLAVDYTFTTAGSHRVALKITYTPEEESEEEPVSYTACHTVRIHSPVDRNGDQEPEIFGGAGTTFPGVGDVWIIPDYALSDGSTTCDWIGFMSPAIIGMFATQLRGPYATREEAEYVIDTWGETLGDYAMNCSCAECSFPNATNIGYSGPLAEEEQLDGGAGDNKPFPSGCNDAWTLFEYSVEQSGDTSIEIRETDGTVWLTINATGSGSVLIPPCLTLETWAMEATTGSIFVSGQPVSLNESEACTLDFETDIATIPNNSSELATYIESLEV